MIAHQLLQLVPDTRNMVMGDAIWLKKSVLPSHRISTKSRVEFEDQSHIFRCGSLRQIDAIELILVVGKGTDPAIRQDTGEQQRDEWDDGGQEQLSLDRQIIEKPDNSTPHRGFTLQATSS